MKIYPEKLAAELGRRIAPVYIVSGDEPLLVQESCDAIRAALRQAGFSERDLFYAEGNFDWEQVMFSASSMSLFADKKILEIRMTSGRPGDKAAAALTAFAEHYPADTVMLLVMPRVDAGVQKRKWFISLEAESVWVQVWPIDLRQMPRWIAGRFNRVGLTASPEAVNALIERVEGNLLAAIQEIERLKLVATRSTINLDDILESVADSSRYDVFTLLDAALNQEYQRTLRIVRGLQVEGTELRAIVPMVARELRNLAGMAVSLEQGGSIEDAMQSARVWNKRKSLVAKCLRRHRLAELLVLQSQIARIDKMIKGIVKGDAWALLTDVMLSLAGKPVISRELIDTASGR